MCVIALTKAGTKMSKVDAEACFIQNSDGAGFSYVDDKGDLHVRKGYMTFEGFWEMYEQSWALFGEDSPFLIHFRIATKGIVGHTNSHPFEVETGKCAVAHNGILWSGYKTDAKSDTNEFVDALKDELKDEKLMEFAKHRFNSALMGNKLAILYNTKNFVILNEYQGEWNKDRTIWFSNTHWQYRAKRIQDAIDAFGTDGVEVDNTSSTYGHGYPHNGHRSHDFMR